MTICAAAALWLAHADALETKVIGMVVDGEFGSTLFRDEIRTLSDADFEVVYPEDKMKAGQWDVARIDASLDALLADPEVDLVVALGVLASHLAARRTDLPKPLVAPFVVDPRLQGIPLTEGTSGEPNLTYLTYPNTIDRDVRALHDLVAFEHLAVLLYAPFLDALPGLPPIAAVEELGFTMAVVPAGNDAGETLAALPDNVDAVYVTPLPGLGDDELRALADGLIEARLPSFSMNGEAEVDLGILAGLNQATQGQRLARRTALAVQEILLGADPATLPVHLVSSPGQLTLNVATAQSIGVSPRWETIWEATLLHEHEALPHEALSLRDAVQQALESNPSLAATERQLAAADADRGRAMSRWLPQVGAAAQGNLVDQASADASFGSRPAQSLQLGATVDQLLYADPALANVHIQHDLVGARSAQLETAQADLAHEVGVAWTTVNRAQALIDVRVNDVQQIRTHLEVARSRRDIGEATDAEVARWDAEIAGARQRMVDARVGHRNAELRLNQLRSRPASDHFLPEDFDPNDPPGGLGQSGLVTYADDAAGFGILVEALVKVGQAAAPELRQLDATIAAQERLLGVSKRAYYVPTVGVSGSAGWTAFRAESDPLPLPPELLGAFPEPPDVSWSAGATVSVPLFQGGARDADRREADASLAGLRAQRDSVAQLVELRIRTSLSAVNGSFAKLELAGKATTGARRNLDWANEAYSRGLASQVQLLDARRTHLNAELGQTDAVFVFLADLLEVQRATNHQAARMPEGAWTAFLDELEASLNLESP